MAVFGVFTVAGIYLYKTLQERLTDVAAYLDSGNSIDLTYLPPDADCYIVVRSSSLRRSRSVREFLDSTHYRDELEPAWELLGLSPGNVDSLTCGSVGFGRHLDDLLLGRAGASRFVTVIRTIEPVERISVQDPFTAGEEVIHRGRPYVRIHGPSSTLEEYTLGVFAADAQTVVFGSEDQVKGAIDRLEAGTPQPRRTELDFVNPEHHLVIVALADTVPAAEREASPSATTQFPAALLEFTQAIERMSDCYSVGLTFAADEIRIEALCQFENRSRQAAFTERIADIKRHAAAQLETEGSGGVVSRSQNWELATAGRRALNQMRVESDADVVNVQTAVPLETLIQRKLLRVSRTTMTPFQLALEDIPQLMLGVGVQTGVD